jgi:hypothetical protein
MAWVLPTARTWMRLILRSEPIYVKGESEPSGVGQVAGLDHSPPRRPSNRVLQGGQARYSLHASEWRLGRNMPNLGNDANSEARPNLATERR